MSHKLSDALKNARGRSEFVVVVVADIRGFSAFSTRNEAPNIAMYIKRAYLQLIDNYFSTATFVKPTGDGLLMTFAYDEDTLATVAQTVVDAALECLDEFPKICGDDPMINFAVPEGIGFGITRGTACCLYSGDEVLDYSGHLLNLASRLTDLARPSGIVIDGQFRIPLLSEPTQRLFKEQPVYLRSIAEDTPIPVHCLEDVVEVPQSALVPMRGETWRTAEATYKIATLQKMSSSHCVLRFPSAAVSEAHVKVTLLMPNKKLRGYTITRGFTAFSYLSDPDRVGIRFDVKSVLAAARDAGLGPRTELRIRANYVPSQLDRT